MEIRAFFARLTRETRPLLTDTLLLTVGEVKMEDIYAPLMSEEDRVEFEKSEPPYDALIPVDDSVSNEFFGRKAGVATFNVFIRDGRVDVALTHFKHTHHVRGSLNAKAPWVLEPLAHV